MADAPTIEDAKTCTTDCLPGPRGPDIDHAAESEDQVPARQGKTEKDSKLGRRQSRLGLRHILGKRRSGKERQGLGSGLSTTDLTGARAPAVPAIPAVDNHQKAAQFDQGEVSPTNTSPAVVEETVVERGQPKKQVASASKKSPASEGHTGSSLPPLFKAVPQAVQYAALPATSLSAEAVLRINEKAATLRAKEDEDNDHVEGNQHGKSKKKTRRTPNGSVVDFGWTKKIYLLMASGHVLQYSGQGNFDRLPEKVLRLGPLSAAFATDAIPGRHWVVQVSSIAGLEDMPGAESRSIFSKLSLRFAERRTAANLLMVFESADTMEAWLAALRGEIEKQGGKKKQSETGRLNADLPEAALLREKTSQRTLIVRDLTHFPTSPRATKSHSALSSSIESPRCEGSAMAVNSSTARNHSLDDISTTNSTVSQEERQLESLRENSNRLSLISSGQRTFITSTGSSPEGSPTHETFDEEKGGLDEVARGEMGAKPKIASEMTDGGRNSAQVTSSPVDEGRYDVAERRAVSSSGSGSSNGVDGRAPNFSVPCASSRRFSYAKAPGSRSEEASSGRQRYGGASPRRVSRTLATMMQSADGPLAATDHSAALPISTKSLGTDAYVYRWRKGSRDGAMIYHGGVKAAPGATLHIRRDSAMYKSGWQYRCPRKIASTSALRERRPSSPAPPAPCAVAPEARRPHIASLLAINKPHGLEERRTHRTFLDVDDSDDHDTRSGPTGLRPDAATAATKRNSGESVLSLSEQSCRSYEVHGSTVSSGTSSNSSATVTNAGRRPKSLRLNRRSMPQIAAVSGPPPAPPPTRALPPIPQKVQSRAG